MSDVFVSYKAEDRRRVKPLVEALEADGFSVWWDEQIGGGAAWRQMIETELNAAKCVLVAWSKRSAGPDGMFVQDEATRAQQRRVYVPVLIEKVHLPLGFGETQALPLTGWTGDRSDSRYQAVLASVRRVIGIEHVAAAQQHRPAFRIDRRTAIGGGAAATVAVAGIGAWALLKPRSAEAADSIAVLPFANLSADPAQTYFSDGIAEELRGALARLAGLKVVGRTSSEAVRNDDAETAAKKLGVSNILTGSVRQSPSTMRISAQLVDGTTGIERWSQNYDRAPGDAITIQTDIAENVARALSITLGAFGRSAITVGGTHNPDAQKLLFQAMQATEGGGREELQEGMSLADAAIKLDPKYADAYARKAMFMNWYASTFARDARELFKMRDEAAETARVALRLAPKSSDAHLALAEIHRIFLELGPAIREYRRALELAPGNSAALGNYAIVAGALGNSAEAERLADQTIRLDPLNGNSYFTRFRVLLAARRYEEAVTFSQELERTKPHLFNWPEGVAYAFILQNRLNDAVPYMHKADPDSYNRMVNQAVILARTGKRSQIAPIIERMHQLYGDAASYQYGQIYAQAGDKDRAFAALDRAWQIRDSGLLRIKSDEFMNPLRSDPRYPAILKKLNFPN